MNIPLGRAIVTLLVAAAPLTLTACGGGTPATGSSATGAPGTGAPGTGAPASGTPATGATSSPTAPSTTAGADPVAFFRSLEPVCQAHAQQTGNPAVDPERFAEATLASDLGGGAYLIEDGAHTRLVVKPAERTVLPESGVPTDVMPNPYAFGCPETVFLGTSHD